MAVAAGVGMATLAGCNVRGPGTGPVGPGGSGRYRSQVVTRLNRTANIIYSQAAGNQPNKAAGNNLQLDLYQPAGDPPGMKRPLIITAYGGAFIFGVKGNAGDPAYNIGQYFAKLGYVWADINYRELAATAGLCTGYVKTAACRNAAIAGISDGIAAVRFLRANADKYGIDPDRIAITGDSAGGVIAAGAGILANVPLDQFPSKDVNRSTPGTSGRVQAFMSVSGGLNEDIFVDRDDSPGLLFHGGADPIVPTNYSTFMTNALKKVGVDARLVIFPGEGHVPGAYTNHRNAVLSQTTDFFYEKLDLANAAS